MIYLMCGKVKIRFGAGFTLSLKGEGFEEETV